MTIVGLISDDVGLISEDFFGNYFTFPRKSSRDLNQEVSSDRPNCHPIGHEIAFFREFSNLRTSLEIDQILPSLASKLTLLPAVVRFD